MVEFYPSQISVNAQKQIVTGNNANVKERNILICIIKVDDLSSAKFGM